MNRSVRYGLTTAGTAVVVIGLAFVIGLISYRHPYRKDLTANQRHSLAPQSVKVLQEMDQPVRFTLFMKEGNPLKPAVIDELELYRYHSPAFSFDVIDPDLTPSRARDYSLDQYGQGPVGFFETDAGRRESVTGIGTIDSKQALEELLTNGLIRVTRGRTKKVYVLSGHGEPALESGQASRTLTKLKKALEDKSYEVADLPLLGQAVVPADCDVLLILGPRKELHPTEIQAVRRYLRDGGRALFALDPQTSRGLAAVAAEYGVDVGDDIVIDYNVMNQLFGGDPLVPIAAKYGTHPITRNFTVATYFPQARSVSDEHKPPFHVTTLISTSADSFAETSFAELQTGRVSVGPEDHPGPVSIGVAVDWDAKALRTAPEDAGPHAAEAEETGGAATDANAAATAEATPAAETTPPAEPRGDEPGPAAEDEGRLVVIGDSDFVTDKNFDAMGNSDLFLNAVNWLAQEEDLIAIRPKTSDNQMVTLTAVQNRIFILLPLLVLPGLVLFAGGVVWYRRRQG